MQRRQTFFAGLFIGPCFLGIGDDFHQRIGGFVGHCFLASL
jgi:hypothetical protein